MNREAIIRMARQAGAHPSSFHGRWVMYADDLEKFAALVAAAERKVIMDSLQKQADLATDALDRRWALEMIAAVALRGATK